MLKRVCIMNRRSYIADRESLLRNAAGVYLSGLLLLKGIKGIEGRITLGTKNNRAGEEGFSLVELIIVMALAAIIMAIAIPGLYTNVPKWHVRGTARDISAKLMMARLKAIQENKLYAIRFTEDVVDSFSLDSSEDQPWQAIDWESTNSVRGEGFGDIDVVLESCVSSGGNRIYFKWDGGADTSGDISTCGDTMDGDPSMFKVVTVASNDGNYSMDIFVGRFTGNIVVMNTE